MRLTVLALFAAALTVFLGYFARREDFAAYIGAYSAFLLLYVWALRGFLDRPGALLALGLALRAMLLFSLPNLSDDYARFLWDGHLTLAGFSPFAHPPSYYMANGVEVSGLSEALYVKLNSPEYHTVYPPVCQAVFAGAVGLFPDSERGAVVVLKLFLLGCEAGSIALLRRWGAAAAAAYALHPLAVLEIVGNVHFEGAMLFFLLAGAAVLTSVPDGAGPRSIGAAALSRAALFWALATASKLLPLMFLPLAWAWLGWRKGAVFVCFFGLAALLLFAPVLPALPNILDSLDLYFRQFQFNASVYYLVREVGFALKGWDVGEYSGPWLGALSLAGMLALAAWAGRSGDTGRLLTGMLFSLALYLALAATVQPWYVVPLLALSLPRGRWHFGMVWAAVAALSYSHYDGGGFQEHFGLIGLEYAAVGAALAWDWWGGKKINKN